MLRHRGLHSPYDPIDRDDDVGQIRLSGWVPGTTHTEREAFPRLTYRSDNGLVAAFAVISLHWPVAWW
jgi:hypothetical protein